MRLMTGWYKLERAAYREADAKGNGLKRLLKKASGIMRKIKDNNGKASDEACKACVISLHRLSMARKGSGIHDFATASLLLLAVNGIGI